MEAVPRLPMIWFQLKVSPEPTSFVKLKQYIRDFYNEDPESYTNEIHQLENLRTMAVRPPIAVTGCSLLKKYYCQLHFVQSRFPMGNDEPAAVSFSWRDAYANMVFSLSNIRFEIISILYNIGSIHTQLGAKTERTSADGMKMACSHFQCAAWAFEHLQNCYPQPPGVDMSPDLMKFMHQLCLAQAQECILEKSMLDNRKPTIVAKVAKQIVDYYALALRTVESNSSEDNTIVDTVGTKFYKTLKSYVQFKRAYYMAVTLLYQGLASEEQQKMGERVAFYNAALVSLNAARSIHSGVKGSTGITGIAGEKEAIEDALVFTNDVIEGKRKAAKNENEFIYHEEVPDKDALSTVNGASLVKGISFNVNDPEISGPDIFARLIPMKVHEASSLYSEEKAKILRSVGTKIEEKDQLLEMYLASLKLQHLSLYDPDCSSVDADNLPLPEELAERCAALNAKPNAIQDLEAIMAKLSATYGDVETVLKDIDKLLTEEDQKEKRYQETVGMRPPTIVATDLTREAKKYEEAHAKASESNQALHRAMALHLNNLQVLSQPLNELMASIPSINGGAKVESEVEKQNVRELKRILGKVEEMQRQRNELHTKLRDSISQDNLTRILITATAESTPLDALFTEHLEKHQSLVNVIDQNLAAQDNVLSALTDAYARTAETRKSVEEILKRRDLMISSLIASYDAYEDLLTKSSKGLEFYRKLEVNVMKLLQRVKSTCRVQEEEREQILARNDKDSGIDSAIMISEPEKKIGSGMKLRDHLANRLKNNSAYSTNYGDKQTISGAPVQQNALAPAIPYPTDNIIGSDGMPIHMVPSVTTDNQGQDSSMYQYYPYTNYYMGQRSSYVSQQYSSYDATHYNGINQSLPRTSTTNTDNMYHQAGAGTSTDVASNSVQYAGYSNVRNDQGLIPSTNQAQYPIHAGYDESNNFSQYQPYNAGQEYQTPNAVYPYVSGQQMNYTQPHPTNNSPPVPSPSHMSTSNQHVGQSQKQNIPQRSTPQVSNVSLQYEPTMQVSNRDGYIHSYVPTIQNESGSSDSRTNYSIVTHETINTIPPTNQQPSQVFPSSDNSNLQYVVSNPHHALTPGHVMNPAYNVQEQYLPTQVTAANPNDASMRTTYSGSPSNIPSANSIDQQHYYHQNTQSNTFQPSPSYILPSQQGYIDQTSVVGQQSIPNSQIPITPPIQTYPNAYGHTYSVDTNGHQYQIQQVPSNPIATQGLTMNYVNDPEIIQSHAKSSNMQGYLQNYQYSTQQDQQSGIIQYPNYSQGYNNTWDNKQIHNSMSNSYKGHPGYSFDATAGNYQYSSGYQDSRDGSQQNPVEVPGDGQANSHYTNANNAATTNLTTSSQYSNGSYQPQIDGQNYNNTSYDIQTSREGTTVTNNPTNTNNTQTYVQSSNNGTMTSNSDMEKSNSNTMKSKSNLDLLAELDITINHAPLVPEVPVYDNEQKDATNCLTPDLPNGSFDEKENDSMSLQIDDKHENLQIVWDTWYNDVQPKKDPLGDPLILQKFITDIEKYEKFVDSLTVKTLSGSTSLDIKWKEIQDNAERECKKQSSNIALTHSNENRSCDWVPYDMTRVKLSALDRSSDYINASYVKDLTQWTPTFIVTQAPKTQSFEAFWSMIWEQGSEVIACLCDDTQFSSDIYWPTSKGITLDIGNFTLSLKNSTNHATHIQRVIGMMHSERKIERIVIHMQYLEWPSSGLPSSPGPLLSFATDIMSEQALRHCPKPIVIHCYDGGPLSSILLLAAATVCHVRAGHGVVDVPLVFSTLAKYRRCLINKELLLFGYRMVRYHAQDTLMKRGILSSTKSTFDGFDGIKGRSVNKHCHPSDDFLQNLGVGIQHGLIRQQGKEQTTGSSQSAIAVKSEEKTDRAKPIDPLSQLDPLWSIRR